MGYKLPKIASKGVLKFLYPKEITRGAYIKWNGPIDLTDNSFDIKSNTCMISEYKWPVFPPI
jgi:hypothetical protein